MIRYNQKGSLLFETFIALMILSIGIVSTLRVFGEALFIDRRDQERVEAKVGTKNLLFEWFAYPTGVKLPEDGVLVLPLGVDSRQSDYWVEVHSKNLMSNPAEPDEEKRVRLQKASQYYQVSCQVSKGQKREVLNLEAVIFKLKQVVNSGT